jgi:hypothetical protein
MWLAGHLGLPLLVCMEQTSEREYHAWMAWRAEQWNQPDRTDHYLMQLTNELWRLCHHAFGGKQAPPYDRSLDEFKISFGPRKEDHRQARPTPQPTHDSPAPSAVGGGLTPEQQRLRQQALKNKAAWLKWASTIPGASYRDSDGVWTRVGPDPEEYLKKMRSGRVPKIHVAKKVGEKIQTRPGRQPKGE